jgi:hypothetical protein
MEASEKPQLPLDGGADAVVRALEDRLVIERLEVADERAARLVRDRVEAGEPGAETVVRAIEIGARVLDREDAAVEVDFVRREYERAVAEHRRDSERHQREMAERMQQELRQAFGDEGGGGTLAEALEAHTREMGEAIESTFGDGSEEGVQRRIEDLIEERNDQFLKRLSADDELNPLRPLVTSFGKWVRERRETQDERDEKLEKKLDELIAKTSEAIGVQSAAEAVAEAEQAGTRKGRSFEERVDAAIERIATARGDVARHVGDEPGVGGTKKGDTVSEIGAADGPTLGRIVFEHKDEQLSKNKAWDELNGAMTEREAEYAVLVVAGEQTIPAGREQLVEYEGNKLIVAVDPELPDELGLDLVYRYARLRLLLRREGELTLDASGVRDAAEEARSALKQAQSIRLALTNVDKSSSKAREGLDSMVASVEERLARIEQLID